jgi:hypothetical protein
MTEEKLTDTFMLKYKNLFAKIDKNINNKIIEDTIKRLKREVLKELLQELNNLKPEDIELWAKKKTEELSYI